MMTSRNLDENGERLGSLMRRKLAVFALAASLTLAGCSGTGASSISLDREVDVEGLTLSVPSGWVEDGDDYGLESLGSSFGSRTFDQPGDDSEKVSNSIIVGYSNEETDMSPDEYALDYFDGIESEKEDETVIDGAECVVYDASVDDFEMHVAFILDMDMTYEITVIGDAVDIDSVLETVSVD